MAQVKGLGYLVIETVDLARWRSFGTDAIGMMEMPAGDDAVHLKADDRPFRLRIEKSGVDRLVCAGWELADDLQFERALAEMRDAGHDVTLVDGDERQARRVNGLARIVDPGGSAIELFYGPVLDHTVWQSPVGVSRFVTGELGLGHVVMSSPRADDTYRFYAEHLGFRLSDVMRFGDTLLRFTHCNPRHHSLALAQGKTAAMLHFMVEAGTLDDVGAAYDRFQDLGVRIKQTIGKHTNDQMVSFYARTPGPFDIEFGCGGIHIDDATWSSSEITAVSFWGHRRPPLSDTLPPQ